MKRRDRRQEMAAMNIAAVGKHMLTHKPAEVSEQDFWSTVLHVHQSFAVVALEAEKWKLPITGEAGEPRDVYLAVMRLALASMAIAEYYRLQVGDEWFDTVRRNLQPLHVKYTLRLLAEYGLLSNYDEDSLPAGGCGADA